MSEKNVPDSSQPEEAPVEEEQLSKAERLRRLYELSESIVDSALGKDKHTKRSLYRLRDRVLDEIRALEAERDAARQRYYAKIRKKMEEVGFVPSSEKQQQEEE